MSFYHLLMAIIVIGRTTTAQEYIPELACEADPLARGAAARSPRMEGDALAETISRLHTAISEGNIELRDALDMDLEVGQDEPQQSPVASLLPSSAAGNGVQHGAAATPAFVDAAGAPVAAFSFASAFAHACSAAKAFFRNHFVALTAAIGWALVCVMVALWFGGVVCRSPRSPAASNPFPRNTDLNAGRGEGMAWCYVCIAACTMNQDCQEGGADIGQRVQLEIPAGACHVQLTTAKTNMSVRDVDSVHAKIQNVSVGKPLQGKEHLDVQLNSWEVHGWPLFVGWSSRSLPQSSTELMCSLLNSTLVTSKGPTLCCPSC